MNDIFQRDIDDVSALEVVPQILDVLQKMTGMGFCAVARVTPDRWIACAVKDEIGFGLRPGGELKVDTTICHEIRQSGEPVAIDNVAEHPQWATHHTPLQYGFKSYISVPVLLGDGSFFGTLCAIDPEPADVNNARVLGMVKLFAELIAKHLDTKRQLKAVKKSLKREVETAQLRDQFIGALAHDIKNPIASIWAGTRMLRRSVDDKGKQILGMMEQSVSRASNIVDNVLDFARGLSGTIVGNVAFGRLDHSLEAIVKEMEALNPQRRIEREFFSGEIAVDHARIGQLFANLLSNALTHGKHDGYVRAGLEREGNTMRLWVANEGRAIPEEELELLFQPFKRRSGKSDGLGLGLYIASEIANAHGGTLEARSSDQETRFTLLLPLPSASKI